MNPQPTFTWSVSGGGSINSAGLFTATTVGSNFTVTAASGGVNGTAKVRVTAAPPVLTSITVTPATASVQNGGSQQFSATGYDQNNSPDEPAADVHLVGQRWRLDQLGGPVHGHDRRRTSR